MKKINAINALPDIIYFFIASVLIFGLVIFALLNLNVSNFDKGQVVINETEIEVDIAKGHKQRFQGLSGRDSLDENQGMLFIYDDYQNAAHCMRGMNFSIDIIWIKDNEIVGIDEKLPLDDCQEIYHSPIKVNYVLEVNSGYSRENNIKIGDIVEISI